VFLVGQIYLMDKKTISLLGIVIWTTLFIVKILYYPFVVIKWCWKKIRHLDPRYLYCRVFHGKSTVHKYWELMPYGIGGGYNIFSLRCSECDRKHWELNREEFEKLGGKNPSSP